MDIVSGDQVRVMALCKAVRSGHTTMPVLSDVELDVEAGGRAAIVGPSGSGKTMLMSLVAALEKPDSGRIEVGAVAVESLAAAAVARYRSGIGLITSYHPVVQYLCALDNVLLAGGSQARSAAASRSRAGELLDVVGLSGKAGMLAGHLPPEDRQRLCIARALLPAPRLILADEPTGGLDTRAGDHILRLVSSVSRQTHATLLVFTRDVEVAAICEQQIRLSDGRIKGQRTLRADPRAVDRAIRLG